MVWDGMGFRGSYAIPSTIPYHTKGKFWYGISLVSPNSIGISWYTKITWYIPKLIGIDYISISI